MSRLTIYGSAKQAHNVAKVGKSKTSRSLAARMPSPEIAAKVGIRDVIVAQTHRVVRRGAQG